MFLRLLLLASSVPAAPAAPDAPACVDALFLPAVLRPRPQRVLVSFSADWDVLCAAAARQLHRSFSVQIHAVPPGRQHGTVRLLC